MTTRATKRLAQYLRRLALGPDAAALTDGQLLSCFIERRDESAFAALVRRHGPMVWGVCRRLLANHHDAEDAFQATFLVLVRKAAAVVPREMVANWLHGVAPPCVLMAVRNQATLAARKPATWQWPQNGTEKRNPYLRPRRVADRHRESGLVRGRR